MGKTQGGEHLPSVLIKIMEISPSSLGKYKIEGEKINVIYFCYYNFTEIHVVLL